MATDVLAQLEEDNRKLREMMGLSTTAQPTATGANATALSTIPDEDANEATGLLNQYMKGRLSSTPPTETFDDYFKRSVRPATEFLQDFTRGFLASSMGQKFVSTREEQYQRYKDHVARQDQIRTMERLELNGKVQSAVQLLRMKEQGTRDAAKLGWDQTKFFEKIKFDQMMKLPQMAIEIKKLEIAGLDSEEKRKLWEEQRKKYQRDLFDTPFLNDAARILQEQGKDIFDDAVVNGELLPMAASFMQKLTREPRKAEIMFRGRNIDWFDGDGQKQFGWIGPQGDILHFNPGGEAEILSKDTPRFTDQRAKELVALSDSVHGQNGSFTFLRSFLTNDLKTMDSLTGILVKAKGDLGRLMSDTTLNPDQKRFVAGLQLLELARTKAITGAQMTNSEREYIAQTIPSIAADPDTLVSVLYTQGALTDAFLAREKAGIKPGELPLEALIETVRKDWIQAFAEARRGHPERLDQLRSMGPLTGDKLLLLAARKAGRQDILEKLAARGIQF